MVTGVADKGLVEGLFVMYEFQMFGETVSTLLLLQVDHVAAPLQQNIIILLHKYLVESDSVIIPYKVINHLFTTLYGIITELLSANYSCTRSSWCKMTL